MAGEKLDKERQIEYVAFCMYRDMELPRDIRGIRQQPVSGKIYSERTWFRWNAKNDWQTRITAWDAEVALKIKTQQIKRRHKDIEEFVTQDFAIGKLSQLFVKQQLSLLAQDGHVTADVRAYRTLMMGYALSRENLKELIGFMNTEVEKCVNAES